MKFPRNARIFRGRLDAAPFASVLFLLVVFLLLGTLIYTPGVHVQVPEAADLPGTDHPAMAVVLDSNGQLYFENQMIQPEQLRKRLREAVSHSAEPLTLLVRADKSVKYEALMNVTLLAREAGFRETLLATLPRTFDTPSSRRSNP